MKSIPIANLYYMLCYAWGILPPLGARRTSFDDFSSPAEIIGSEICRVSTAIVKRHLAVSFVSDLERTRRPRGKINFTQSVREPGYKRKILVCASPGTSIDTLPNRILKAALALLARQERLNATIRKDAFALEQRLSTVSTITADRSAFNRLSNLILPKAYRYPMALCELLMLRFSPADGDGSSWFDELYRDEARMRRVFEGFLRGFLQEHMPHARVGARRFQMADLQVRHGDGGLIPHLNMDVVLEFAHNKSIVIDAKFTANQISSHHGTSKIRSEHFYQIFSYVCNVKATQPSRDVSGLVLYPDVGELEALDFSVCGSNFSFRPIDLSKDWRSIHDGIVDIVHQLESMPSPTGNASNGGTAFPISLA